MIMVYGIAVVAAEGTSGGVRRAAEPWNWFWTVVDLNADPDTDPGAKLGAVVADAPSPGAPRLGRLLLILLILQGSNLIHEALICEPKLLHIILPARPASSITFPLED